jgi:predicted heme/steroid binding protein
MIWYVAAAILIGALSIAYITTRKETKPKPKSKMAQTVRVPRGELTPVHHVRPRGQSRAAQGELGMNELMQNDPISVADLAKHDGSDPSKPIYIAIKGRVFDVTAKKEMYGVGGGYHVFAGKDASKGLGASV